MKKSLLLSAILVGALVISCKKQNADGPDTMAPIFNLKGKKFDTVPLNSASYVDSGAVAIDDFDGDISKRVVVTGSLNLNLAGNYIRFYDVADLTGNKAAQLSRSIVVKNDASFLDGIYIATANCGATNTSSFVSTVVSSASVNNEISINGIGTIDTGIVMIAKLNGLNLAVTPGIKGYTSYSGSAVVNSNKREFVLNYAISKPVSINYACSTTYKKQ